MKIWGRKDEVSFAEEVIGRFFQPLKGVKISLMIIASFGLLLLFLSLGLNLYPHLPYGFPASLFLSLLIFLGGLTSAVILYAIDKAKIGHWFVITNKGIRKGGEIFAIGENKDDELFEPKPGGKETVIWGLSFTPWCISICDTT